MRATVAGSRRPGQSAKPSQKEGAFGKAMNEEGGVGKEDGLALISTSTE